MDAVKRALGWAALLSCPDCQGLPCQSIRFLGASPSRPSHQGSLVRGFNPVLVKSVGANLVPFKVLSILGLVFIDVPGATPKSPVSGLIAHSRPSVPTLSQAISSPKVQTKCSSGKCIIKRLLGSRSPMECRPLTKSSDFPILSIAFLLIRVITRILTATYEISVSGIQVLT